MKGINALYENWQVNKTELTEDEKTLCLLYQRYVLNDEKAGYAVTMARADAFDEVLNIIQDRNPTKRNFAMSDFAKGLMLAGYVAPANQQEVDEKAALEVYEKYKLKVGDKTQYGTIKYIDLFAVIYEEMPDIPFALETYTAFPSNRNK